MLAVADRQVSETRYILKGIPDRSIGFTRYGQTLLDNLQRMMKFQNLQQLTSRTVLLDGTEIVCQSVFGQRQVTITTVPRGVEERRFVEKFTGGVDKYLIVYGAGENLQTLTPEQEEPYVKFFVFDPFNPTKNQRFRLSATADRETDHKYKSGLEPTGWRQLGHTSYNEVLLTSLWKGWAWFSSTSCVFAEFPSLKWVVNIGQTISDRLNNTKSVIAKIFNQSTGGFIDEFVLYGMKTDLHVALNEYSTIPQFDFEYFAIEHITSLEPPYTKTIKISQSGLAHDAPSSEYPYGRPIAYAKVVTTIGLKPDGTFGVINKAATPVTVGPGVDDRLTIASIINRVNDWWYIFDGYEKKWSVCRDIVTVTGGSRVDTDQYTHLVDSIRSFNIGNSKYAYSANYVYAVPTYGPYWGAPGMFNVHRWRVSPSEFIEYDPLTMDSTPIDDWAEYIASEAGGFALNLFYPLNIFSAYVSNVDWHSKSRSTSYYYAPGETPPNWPWMYGEVENLIWQAEGSTQAFYRLLCKPGEGNINFFDTTQIPSIPDIRVGGQGINGETGPNYHWLYADDPREWNTSKHFIPVICNAVGRHSALLSIASHTKAAQYQEGVPHSGSFDGPPATNELRRIYIQYPTGAARYPETIIDNPGGLEDIELKVTPAPRMLAPWIDITVKFEELFFNLTGEPFDFQKLFGIFLYKD
jgi:hypothetical protein